MPVAVNVTWSATCVRNQLIHLFLIQSWLEPVSGSVKSLQLFGPLSRILVLSVDTYELFILAVHAGTFIFSLQVISVN